MRVEAKNMARWICFDAWRESKPGRLDTTHGLKTDADERFSDLKRTSCWNPRHDRIAIGSMDERASYLRINTLKCPMRVSGFQLIGRRHVNLL